VRPFFIASGYVTWLHDLSLSLQLLTHGCDVTPTRFMLWGSTLQISLFSWHHMQAVWWKNA